MVAAHAAGGGNEVKQLGVVRAQNAQRFVSGRWSARDGAIGDFTEIEHRSTIEQCSISVKRDAGHIRWWRVWALLRLQSRPFRECCGSMTSRDRSMTPKWPCVTPGDKRVTNRVAVLQTVPGVIPRCL